MALSGLVLSLARRTSAVTAALGTAAAILAMTAAPARAGDIFRPRAVGGISVDATGVVGRTELADVKSLREFMAKETEAVGADLMRPVGMRMISLKGLEAAIEDAIKNRSGELPDEVRYMAGLQRIEYVFVHPEENDIVFAGPGEGWKVNELGAVVGVTTGRPVLQLEDFVVAMRSVDEARTEGISCSIDPTEEGRNRLQAFLSRQRTVNPAVLQGVQQAMGPQIVSITGVPADTHYARVLVAADFRMKQYGMGLEQAPVRDLPSFLQILQQRRAKPNNMTPRWWLAPSYEPIAKSEDGLAFQLKGQGVKAMTEDEFIEGGEIKGAGKANPLAQRWADLFTEKFEELCKADPAFGDLRNIMDQSVVAALIKREGLLEKAGASLPLLTGQDERLTVTAWNAPASVPTQSSFIQIGNDFVITASGGVQIESWQVAAKTEVSPAVAEARQKGGYAGARWWWNAEA
ncbi:MAG TPA: DUF1598 domain-containing protein [Pirellulaceae bacterium]|jgi:hypothetical protein|nr:DUF1598 domain-containing protein [Pirellulaceae bacterium]